MSGPSDKAVEAAANSRSDLVEVALHAAHDPALGLDRSVCLRDVVEALKDVPAALIFIEREFGEKAA